MGVHSRDKKISPEVDFEKVARATAGFTGAQLMNLMNQAAITAVRQVRSSTAARLGCLSIAAFFPKTMITFYGKSN